MAAVQQLYPLLIDRNLLALDAKYLEKFIVKGLRLAALIVRVFPFVAERLGSPSVAAVASRSASPSVILACRFSSSSVSYAAISASAS